MAISGRSSYFDFQLVAVMQQQGIATLVTENEKDFSDVEEVVIVNPFR